MTTNRTTRRVRQSEVQVGDSIMFLGRLHRVTGFRSYNGPLVRLVERFAVCDGGWGMALERDGWVEVAA